MSWSSHLSAYKRLVFQVSLVLLFLSALGIRVYNLNAPGMLPEREFRSMFIARVHYFERRESIADWQRQIARISMERLGILEPPILETTVAELYILAGGEHIQIARILTSTFWVIGGFFLFKIAQVMMSSEAAFLATAYYLFVPLGVLTSRSFQPDSLMIMLFLASLLAILWYDEQPSIFRVSVAAFVSAVTLLVKPLPIFTVFAAFWGLAIYRKGWRSFIDKQFLTYTFITLLPVALYYGYGLFGSGFLDAQAEMSFRPNLLIYQEFWENWMITGVGAVSYTALVGGLLGWSLVSDGRQRVFLTALWIGFAVFGLIFTHHIHTHGYYHLQLVVIIALSFGPLFTYIISHLSSAKSNWYRPFSVAMILGVVIFFNIRDVRTGLYAPSFESKQLAEEIGELVNHSSHLVLVSRHYGQSLEYYGQLSGTPWPKAIEYWLYRRPGEQELSIQERLDNLGFEPDYFVITDFNGLNNRHPDLKEYLNTHCPVFTESEKYLIYAGNCT